MSKYSSEMFDPELILPKPVAVNQLPEAQVLAMYNSNEPGSTNPFATIQDLNQFEDQEVVFNLQEPKLDQNHLYIDTGLIFAEDIYPIFIPEDYVVTEIFLQETGSGYKYEFDSNSVTVQEITTPNSGLYNVAVSNNASGSTTLYVICTNAGSSANIEECRILVVCKKIVFQKHVPETVSFLETVQEKSNEIVVLFDGPISAIQLNSACYVVSIDDTQVDVLNVDFILSDVNNITIGVTLTIDGVIAAESDVQLSTEDILNFWGGSIPDITNVQVPVDLLPED